ncbi:MAG: hypothetical protein ACI9WU_003652 [Myxococcota bacterium]
MLLTRSVLWGVLGALLFTVSAHAQTRQKLVPLPDWLKLDAEYRVESIFIDPVDLNGSEVTDMRWTEQRLKVDFGLRVPKYGGIYVQMDALNGVLFGDNGDFGGDPSSNGGLSLAARNPNTTAWEVGLKPGADPLSYDSYVPQLRGVSPIGIRHIWAEALLPIGILRIGRMPTTDGALIASHDGGRRNRWGVSRYYDTSDRVLFATKLDAIAEVIAHGKDAKLDPNPNNGVLFGIAYDWASQDNLLTFGDDGIQVNTLLAWKQEKADWFGADWRNFVLQTVFVYKKNVEFDTEFFAFPTRFYAEIGPVTVNTQFTVFTGKTREVSEGMAKLSGKVPKVQDILAFGAHAFLEYDTGPVQVALEVDYASGDADPRAASMMSQLSFARDFNVGLLMFEHTLAMQTARAMAVGIENLRQLDAASFPLTEVGSQGRFHNALAIFPQVKWDIMQGPKHHVHLRLGGLFAFAPQGVVDPVATILQEDGNEIEDDAVNWFGGKPGSYYGTEIDAQLEWSIANFFTWTLEAAVLFPGDGLQDEHGIALTSFMFENRFVFAF